MTTHHESTHQQYTLSCRMNEEAAALERLCRVVRVRGFRISKMAMESSDGAIDIALTLEGSRPIAMLQSQLEKLQTVAGVELIPDALVRSRTA